MLSDESRLRIHMALLLEVQIGTVWLVQLPYWQLVIIINQETYCLDNI